MSTLLPSNASGYEKSLSLSMDPLGKLGSGADAIARFKSVPGDGLLPFLIWEYGLGEVQEYLVDPRRVIREGLLWQRLRGTPAALHMAFSWIGQQISIEEDKGDYWATYQLGLPQIASEEDVRRVLHLARLSQPARCRLWRIYTTTYDRRPIVLSEGPVLGDGWLSFYSGVPVSGGPGDENVLVSFGARNSFQAGRYLPDDVCGSFGSTIRFGFLVPYLDRFVVGRSALSQPYPRNHGFAMSSLFSILWADRETIKRGWRGYWDARSWLEYTGYDRKLSRWRIRHRSFSRSQLVPGWGERLSETNARLGGSFATVIDNPPRLSDFRLSLHDPERREIRVHEFIITSGALATGPVNPKTPQRAGAARFSFAFPEEQAERAPSSAHSVLAVSLTWEPGVPQCGSHQVNAAQSLPLGPSVAVPSAIRTFAAPRWSGPWASPGRAWDTSEETAVQ